MSQCAKVVVKVRFDSRIHKRKPQGGIGSGYYIKTGRAESLTASGMIPQILGIETDSFHWMNTALRLVPLMSSSLR